MWSLARRPPRAAARTPTRRALAAATLCAALALAGAVATGQAPPAPPAPAFFDDDPIAREPETQDASGAKPFPIELRWDLTYNLFDNPGYGRSAPRARDLNTIDEVPDSSWFTNRVLARPLSIDEITRGPLTGSGPAPGGLTVIASKSVGDAPGFVARDAAGQVWFVSFDAAGHPEAATAAILVANKLFWALGYWQVENHLTTIRPDELVLADSATWRPPSGHARRTRFSDLEQVLRRAHRSADGSYRAVAARGLSGKILEGFQYFGTRPDDPNDVVPHEHRRSLRALRVFGAWTNLVDMKAGNTLDVVVRDNGRGIVRHYLQDVGSTFGTSANGPREWSEGWEYLIEAGKAWKRLVTLGFYVEPWQTARYTEFPAVGRFEGDAFDPRAWRPRAPTAAFLQMRDDDAFWAARRVAAFTDEMIRAAVATGGITDPAAARHLADVIGRRRDKIARTYLPAINPLVDFALDDAGRLTFDNAAVRAGVAQAPRGGYATRWFHFDNRTASATLFGEEAAREGTALAAPAGLPTADGRFVKVEVSAVDPPEVSWSRPVSVYFKRTDGGWKLVGLERLP